MSRLDIEAIEGIYQSDKGIINVLSEYSEKHRETGDEGKYHVPLTKYQAEVNYGDCVTYETTIDAGKSRITRTQELCQSQIDKKLYIITSPGAKTVSLKKSDTLFKTYGFRVETCLRNPSKGDAVCYNGENTFKTISKEDYEKASENLRSEMEKSAIPGSSIEMKDCSQTIVGNKILFDGKQIPDTENVLGDGTS